jgi:hypothetical protein
MKVRTSYLKSSFLALAGATLVAACASAPREEAPPAGEKARPVWSVATEAETAAALDAKFQEAAKSYVKLKKDGVLMFCKKQREIGSNIPTIHCLTEAQLRLRVERMEEYRSRQRNIGKCPHGPLGCRAE